MASCGAEEGVEGIRLGIRENIDMFEYEELIYITKTKSDTPFDLSYIHP
jgi:hypothetical protein